MVGTIRTAQEAEANGVLNRDTPPKGPRPTAKGEDRIQMGKAFMKDWPLPKMEAYMKGLKEGKEKTVLLACIKRKESKRISTIATEMRRSPNTVRGWLARGRDRGLYDLDGHKPPGRAPMPDRIVVETIRGWLSKSPTEFGYKKMRWQRKMVQQTIRRNLNMPCSAHTVRRVMHLVRFSYRKSRPAPRKSASEEQGFKANAEALLARLALLGYLIMSLDEASCMVGGWNGYGWLPVGGRKTLPISWSKKAVRLIGVLGDGWFHIGMVDSANSDTLKAFLDKAGESVGGDAKMAVVMDSVSYHDAQKMEDYESGLKGRLVRIFTLKYTPQLNPMETLWRDLKHALAGGCFESIDELKAAMTDMVNAGELHPPKLMDYMLPDGAKPARIPCKIWDTTTKAKSAKPAAA